MYRDAFLRIAWMFSAALTLVSCVKSMNLDAAMRSYHQAKSCCASISDLPIGPTIAEGETIFSITDADPAFDFGDDGLSYFKSFQIPALGQPFHIVVQGDWIENGYPSKGVTVFYPVITLLDERRHVLGETSQSQFKLALNIVRRPARAFRRFDRESFSRQNQLCDRSYEPTAPRQRVSVRDGRP